MELGGRASREESLTSVAWAFHRTPYVHRRWARTPQSSPLAGQKKQSSVECSGRRRRHLIGPDSWRAFSPGSSHEPGPMTVGQERGPLVPVRAWNRDKWVQTNWDQCPMRPGWPPRLTNRDVCLHWSQFMTEPGLMGWPGLNLSPVFY